MHEWTVHGCKAFSTAFEYWQYQVPAAGLDFRFVIDSLLALGAFHASRRPPSLWIPTMGRMVPVSELTDSNRDLAALIPNNWGLTDQQLESYRNAVLEKATSHPRAATPNSQAMLHISHKYFDAAIEGHRNALTELTVENIEAAYVASILISFLALCNLGDAASVSATPNPALWLQLGSATRTVVHQWQQMVGPGWMAFAGVLYGKPEMTNEAELFHPEHARPFGHLLTHGREYENMSDEDAKAYQESLSYIGLMYKGIVEGFDPPQATCRRLTAMPSRLPPRFTEFVVQRQPRAIAMLAHVFGCMELLDGRSPWFGGIAKAQIPKIQQELPPAWASTIEWPIAVVQGNMEPSFTAK